MSNADDDNSVKIDLTGKIMLVSIIFLFFMLVFVFCLHLYARWYWSHQQAITTATAAPTRRRRRRRLDFAAGHYQVALESTSRHRGLDPSVLKAIPVVTIDPKKFKDEVECAVCLCEVSEGEKARLLPKCSHWFHVDCIDMWFQSHSTCPLCRSTVSSNQKQENCNGAVTVTECTPDMEQQDHHREGSDVEEPSSSSSMASTTDGVIEEVAIEIPQQIDNDEETTDGVIEEVAIEIPQQIDNDEEEEEEEEEQKSTLSTRFRSLTRLLSGGNSTRVNPSSPRNLDQEQV